MIAGHPTQIVCDADVNRGPSPPPAGFVVEAWTPYGGDTIHMHPSVCRGLSFSIGFQRFAASYRVLLHESAHAKGVRSEDCAELYAHRLAAPVLAKFFDPQLDLMRFGLYRYVERQVKDETLKRPLEYQPRADSCRGEP